MTTGAARHPIVSDRPCPDFFAGALLGNGGLGAVVTTRPDAVAIHFGHNDVWDVRVAEEHADKIGTFADIFARLQQISGPLKNDPWLREYCRMADENYAKPYPRPFPCGTLIFGFDRRAAEVLGHRLDIATGVCAVEFLVGGERRTLEIFADMTADRLWLRMKGAPFDRVRILPDPETPKELPRYVTSAEPLAFRQELPPSKSFRLATQINQPVGLRDRAGWTGTRVPMAELERALPAGGDFVACAQLDQTSDLPLPDLDAIDVAAAASRANWAKFWSRSGVALGDEFLEGVWYRNLYFLHCAVRPGTTCPGLWANWSYRQIGTAWHGDYHMNYNTQQLFWVTFSSNHVEKHLPYVDLVDHLLPVSRKWAREYYGLPGAYFPHSAYPTRMHIMPYWVPTWAWEICETPWTVQSLWWHYRYTLDKEFLAQRAYGPIREAVEFLVGYMSRPEAQRGDGRYHVFPTVAPELYGLTDQFRLNWDCLVDLTLIKFVFRAFLEASAVLGRAEPELAPRVRDILAHFPEYPTADTPRGKVFVSVPGEDPDIVYNCPNSTVTVFPGEDHGLHSPPAEFAIAANSYRHQCNEGGNDLVFLNLQGARLGLLDLEKFKRQIRYCLLPNGTCTDLVLQSRGRYGDELPFDFMARMGIWCENFALPAVINECLLQSYTGALRLFPNWPVDQRAEFHNLRAVGAFLVSASFEAGAVQWIEILSEAGHSLRLMSPWEPGRVIDQPTRPGQRLRFTNPFSASQLPISCVKRQPT